MRKIALVALALLMPLMASTALAASKPRASHPPVLKHQMNKGRIRRHVKPHYVKGKHATVKHPRAAHPKNPHLAEVRPHKAKSTNLQREGNKTALKASKKHHKFLFFR